MRDAAISLPRINTLHPKFRAQAQAFVEDAENTLNLTFRVASAFRSFAEQQKDYDQGRKIPGKIITWSPPGTSYHNYGLAVDIVVVNPDGSINWNYDYRNVLPIAARHGIAAGLNFPSGKKDPDHFENTFGYNWRDLLHKYNAGDFIPGTQYVNI